MKSERADFLVTCLFLALAVLCVKCSVDRLKPAPVADIKIDVDRR